MDNSLSLAQPIPTEEKLQKIQRKKNLKKNIIIAIVVGIIFITSAISGFIFGNNLANVPVTNKVNSEVEENTQQITPTETNGELKNCNATFASNGLNLNFDYDNCVWTITEELFEPEQGVFSTITALHMESGNTITIKANSVGMGGGYPSCINSGNIQRLNSAALRIKISDNNDYIYLTSNNNYGIKGEEGDNGDVKYQEYINVIPSVETNGSNICYRTGGINMVEVKAPKENTNKYRDLTVEIIGANSAIVTFLVDSDKLFNIIQPSIIDFDEYLQYAKELFN